jgi:hypothetical protein
MLRFSLWLVVLAFEERRSDMILVKRKARRVLLFVAMRSGKSVFRRL